VVDTLAPKYDVDVMREYSIPMLTLSAAESRTAGFPRVRRSAALSQLQLRF
jgi:hypothetical protein